VTGPGRIADKLDGASHVALVKLLDELPPGSIRVDRLRKRPPRLPFFLLGDMDEASAGELCGRLREIGFEARVERKASLAPREIRRKVRWMAWRYFRVVGFVGALLANASNTFMGRLHALWPLLLSYGTIFGGLLISSHLLPAIRFRRPLVELAGVGADRPTLLRLAPWLTRLGRRDDRRLQARLLDRLELASALGAGDGAEVLGKRAELACRGLAALDEESGLAGEVGPRPATTTGSGPDDLTGALGRLREIQRIRGVFLADLLRSFSRAEELCARLARIEGLAAREQAGLLARELSDLETEIEAEEDIAALLS
jgi:hypothetical protein